MSIFEDIDWSEMTLPQGTVSARWNHLPQCGVTLPMVIEGESVNRSRDMYYARQQRNRIKR